MTSHALQTLIQRTKTAKMTPQEREQQRRSFAYGNTKIENDDITREIVDRQAEAIEAERDRKTR